MVLINNEFFQIYELDSENTIIRRIADKYKTLPKYLYFTNGKPKIEDMEDIIIEDLLETIKKSKSFNDIYNYLMPISQGGESEIEKLPNITPRELLITWFVMNNIKNLEKAKQDIISNKKFNSISTILQSINRDDEKQKIEQDIKDNKELVKNELTKFQNLEIIDSVEKTKFILENISMKITLDINNKSIFDIFNDIILTDIVPLATCDKFTKIIKDFTPPTYDWDSDRIEDIIILKVNSKISNINPVFTNVYIGKENIDIKAKIVISTTYGNLSERIFINNVLNTIGSPSIKNKIIDNVEGVFYIRNQSLNIYIFAELIMNNSLFSSLLVIDEHEKATKERSDIFTIFNHPIFGLIHSYITPKIAVHGDQVLKRQDIKLGESYIRIKVTKAINKKAVKSYMNIMGKLFTKYNEIEEEVKQDYRVFIPDFAIKVEKPVIEEELTLEKLNPDLFVAGYRRQCNKKRVVSIVPDDQVDELKKQGIPLLFFPKNPEEGPQFWYRCNNEKCKYPGLKFRKNLKTKYPVYPCCFANDPSLKSAYIHYFNPEKAIAEDNIKGVKILTSKKRMVKYDVLAKLPDDINNFFTSIEPGWEYVRSGIDITSSSFLECIMRAVESLSEDETSRLETVITARDELNKFALCKQEAYDKTIEEIKDIVKSESKYLDPKIFIRLLEETYGLNIYLFERIEDKSQMIIPRHVQSYYKITKNAPSVCILIHKGSEIDVSPNPQCELIVRYKDGHNINYIYDYGSIISNELSDAFDKISKSYALESVVNRVIFPWPTDDSNVKIISQCIDSYGKTRILNLKFNKNKTCTLITTPLPNFDVPEVDIAFTKTSIENAKLIINILKIQDVKQYVLNEIVTSITGKIGNIDIIIPIKDSNLLKDIQIVREGLNLPTDDISLFNTYNKNNKLSRYITEYLLWLFSWFVHENQQLTYEIALNNFINSKIIVNSDFVYRLTSNIFTKDDRNGVTKDGKLVVLSEEMEKRLIYVLRLTLKFNKKKINSYYNILVIENFYKNVTDFTEYSNQIIFEGNKSIEKWINEKKKNYKLSKRVLDSNSPYFFNNILISSEIFIAQNLDSWEKALGVAIIWKDKQINLGNFAPEENNISFTLYQYISSSEINKIKIEGDDNMYNVKIIGWKNKIEKRILKKGFELIKNENNIDDRFKIVIEEKDVFTVLLPIN